MDAHALEIASIVEAFRKYDLDRELKSKSNRTVQFKTKPVKKSQDASILTSIRNPIRKLTRNICKNHNKSFPPYPQQNRIFAVIAKNKQNKPPNARKIKPYSPYFEKPLNTDTHREWYV